MSGKGNKKGKKTEKKSKKSKSDRRETDDVGQASHNEQGTFDGANSEKPLSKKEKRKLKKLQRKNRNSSDNAQSNSSPKEPIQPSNAPGESYTNSENSDADRLEDLVHSTQTSRNSDQQNTRVDKQQVPNGATERKRIKNPAESTTKGKEVNIMKSLLSVM